MMQIERACDNFHGTDRLDAAALSPILECLRNSFPRRGLFRSLRLIVGRNGLRYTDQKAGIPMRMVYLTVGAGLCAIASCAWGGVRFYEKGGAEKSEISLPSTVERTNKSDRMVRAFNLRGAVMPAFFVEIADSQAAVTVRDRDGSILYRVSPTERVTVVAKRAVQTPVSAPQGIGSSDTAKELPDGCEGAFSPYVEPGMAHVIGRCVSELTGNLRMASASR
jgi:hypothetical protein